MEQKENMKRSGNWNEKEKIILVQKVLEKENIIFGKLKGCGGVGGVTHSDKERAWVEVTEAVNAISSEPRTVHQCRKQYDNIKQRAKEKLHEIKMPQTGGGPKPSDPPLSQQILLELGERPQMCGLYACLDTEVENLEEEVEKITYSGNLGYEPLPGPSSQSLSTDSMANKKITSNASTQHFRHKSNKRMKTSYTYADAEEENLKLENKKIELETIKLGKNIKENEMIQKLDANLSLKKEIILLKKEILLQQATQVCFIEQ
ncbi:hypothetical protein ACJMK2_028148 [Sinanodonta woodiana]|uniref:Myb/SANT-like DNA-binding domain-containing protein n=1 Tax=Sinanodonta woodiana TaxID=1069815 RepID=A0ABD3X9S5_SINWO